MRPTWVGWHVGVWTYSILLVKVNVPDKPLSGRTNHSLWTEANSAKYLHRDVWLIWSSHEAEDTFPMASYFFAWGTEKDRAKLTSQWAAPTQVLYSRGADCSPDETQGPTSLFSLQFIRAVPSGVSGPCSLWGERFGESPKTLRSAEEGLLIKNLTEGASWWLSWLSICFQIRSWSHSPGIEPHFRLPAQQGAYYSLSLCLPHPLLVHSLFLKKKKRIWQEKEECIILMPPAAHLLKQWSPWWVSTPLGAHRNPTDAGGEH